ncbi:MAG: QueT transporter family protein [Clostridia bacterium]|nr:QueT transporter family protein [Clostridia bacterium]
MKKTSTTYVAQAAVIAAFYAVLTLLLQPVSFAGSQLRVSEALTLLPVLTPAAVPGLAIGCLISNLASPYGVIDIVLGTLATLLAAVFTRRMRNVRIKNLPVFSAVFPVLFNAVAVGASIAIMNEGGFTLGIFAFNALTVALGESIVCFVLGLPLCRVLEKTKIFRNKEYQ